MIINISNRYRATLIGVLILAAYSMLTYTVTGNKILGVITDIISGLSVIAIPLLMFPIFNTDKNKWIHYGYLISRFIEGLLMLTGSIIMFNPALESFRDTIYNDIHVYFFMSGALFFYILFYRTQVIPRFISIWGGLATIALLVETIIKLFGISSPILNSLLLPIVLNEFFLAIWLIIKGFTSKTMEKDKQRLFYQGQLLNKSAGIKLSKS